MNQLEPNVSFPLYWTKSPPDVFAAESGHSHSDMKVRAKAAKKALDNRDVFLGARRCVICGISGCCLQYCFIQAAGSDAHYKGTLEQFGWVPAGAQASPRHERNGLVLCANHHVLFTKYRFFIRFQPATKKYILVYYNSFDTSTYMFQYHGKAIALDADDTHAPLPLLFLVHEYMVRGINIFPPNQDTAVTNDWQKWMVVSGVVNEKDDGSFTFNRDSPTSRPPSTWLYEQETSSAGTAPPSGSRTVIMPPNADLVKELLAYQHTMPSWKAWQSELLRGYRRRVST